MGKEYNDKILCFLLIMMLLNICTEVASIGIDSYIIDSENTFYDKSIKLKNAVILSLIESIISFLLLAITTLMLPTYPKIYKNFL